MGETICLYGRASPDVQNFLREATLFRTFADVILHCLSGERFLTHRLVLSAASPYLKKLLQDHENRWDQSEPMTILLAEIESTELSAILDFIYTGSTKVSCTRLKAFLRAAAILHIRLPPLPTAMLLDTLSPDPKDTSFMFDSTRTSSLTPYDRYPKPTRKNEHATDEIPPPQESLPFCLESCEKTRLTSSKCIDRMDEPSDKLDYLPAMAKPEEERRWIMRSRHVANRVIMASPWRQIVRLYHSPKVPSDPTADACEIGQVSYGTSGDKDKKDHFFSMKDSMIELDGAIDSNERNLPRESKKSQDCLARGTRGKEKPFRCADCGKEFSQLRNYKYHRSVHEGTREFAASCPECGKYFNDRGYLSSHMKIHRNRKEYACLVCGKSFNQRVAYNMHAKIHTGSKPHACDQCGKAFSRKMLLKQHLRTHSGERPYRCHICQKAFADRSNMTLHTKLHSGLKPYQCTLCSKAFTKKHHLKTHLNSHTGSKPYSCSKCGLQFSQSSNMRTHFKKCTRQPISATLSSGNDAIKASYKMDAPSFSKTLE